MSKKERIIVKVDEDKIKRMIAGEEPFEQDENTGDNRPKESETAHLPEQIPDESSPRSRPGCII